MSIHTVRPVSARARCNKLVTELELLLAYATVGAELRGLIRLRVMAGHCAKEGGELVFIGD